MRWPRTEALSDPGRQSRSHCLDRFVPGSATLPDIPTLGDFQPGFEATAWIGIGAPKNTPLEIIDKLNNEVNAGLADPKIAAQIADLAATVFTGSPAELDKLVVEQTEKWGKVIRAANIKPEG